MRVALFFDGKNFYSGWREAARGRRIDFTKLADWLVKKANGSHLWGAYYYTSIEENIANTSDTQQKLSGFLDMLETQSGFFVKTFKRKVSNINCLQCGSENRYILEKEVDTAMVAHMVNLAATNAYDAIVLLSGDADYAPALEAIRSLGKQAYVASWAGAGVSKRIRNAAFDHIDMLLGLEFFERELSEYEEVEEGFECEQEAEKIEIESVTGDLSMDSFLAELDQAQSKFNGGYVGLGYFLTRWRSSHLDTTPEIRRQVLDKLLSEGFVETYNAPDGALAIRVSNKIEPNIKSV
ncbi:NYN domain-containing protein [Sulfobacillus acidophilus]|uniref:NYN domain-containing protein n=1 Tax=Sulfobacillus acidophilus TaxID=53633 RepID=A0ABS3AWB0_9FIRM|nr:NYN domain-containing protein [Sulfobacillus acidophilus]